MDLNKAKSRKDRFGEFHRLLSIMQKASLQGFDLNIKHKCISRRVPTDTHTCPRWVQ